jgi:hypothetical protein
MRTPKKRVQRGKRPVAAALAAVLILTLGAWPAYAQKRRGASVVVVTRDGGRSGGELIAVKRDSLLVMDESGRDHSFELDGVESVVVTRSPRVGMGALFGMILGLGAGIGLSSALYHDADPCESIGRRASIILLGPVVGLVGGALAGSAAGKDLTIRIPGGSDPGQRVAALVRLRKYARVGVAG